MYRWLFVIGLILLVILAGGLTESTYTLDGYGRSSGHGWGGHGYAGHGYSGHGWEGYGWGGHGRFFSPWNLLIPPFPIPVPVPVPPVVRYPYYRPYCSPYFLMTATSRTNLGSGSRATGLETGTRSMEVGKEDGYRAIGLIADPGAQSRG